MEINSICVYCGSSPGRQPEYVQAAQALGAEIGKRSIRLVYGGARVGLMGRWRGLHSGRRKGDRHHAEGIA